MLCRSKNFLVYHFAISLLILRRCLLCEVKLFVLFWGLTTQLPNKSHTGAYSQLWMPGLRLACFFPVFLNLYVIPTTFCLWAFIFLYFCVPFFISFSMACYGWPLMPSSSCSLSSHLLAPRVLLLFILCLLALPVLVTASVFIRSIRCFRQAKDHSFTVKYSVNKVTHLKTIFLNRCQYLLVTNE